MCVVPTLGHSGSQGTEAAWARLVYTLKWVQHWGLSPALLELPAQWFPNWATKSCSLTRSSQPGYIPSASWADASQAHVRVLNRLFLIENRFRFTAKKSEGSRDFSHIKTFHTASSMISSTPKGKCLRADWPARHTVTTNSPPLTLKFTSLLGFHSCFRCYGFGHLSAVTASHGRRSLP